MAVRSIPLQKCESPQSNGMSPDWGGESLVTRSTWSTPAQSAILDLLQFELQIDVVVEHVGVVGGEVHQKVDVSNLWIERLGGRGAEDPQVRHTVPLAGVSDRRQTVTRGPWPPAPSKISSA